MTLLLLYDIILSATLLFVMKYFNIVVLHYLIVMVTIETKLDRCVYLFYMWVCETFYPRELRTPRVCNIYILAPFI